MGGGAGGQGQGAAQPGLFGLAQQQQQQQQAGGGGAMGANPFAGMGMGMGGQNGGSGLAGLEAMLRGTGAQGEGAQGGNPMAGMEGLFGPGSPFGQMGAGQGFGSFAPPQPQDGRSPEERYEVRKVVVVVI